jgi:hypothetical protein
MSELLVSLVIGPDLMEPFEQQCLFLLPRLLLGRVRLLIQCSSRWQHFQESYIDCQENYLFVDTPSHSASVGMAHIPPKKIERNLAMSSGSARDEHTQNQRYRLFISYSSSTQQAI